MNSASLKYSVNLDNLCKNAKKCLVILKKRIKGDGELILTCCNKTNTGKTNTHIG